MIGSSALKINEISSSLVVAPSDTSGDEMLIVGDVPSYDQLNSELLLFLFPALSIKLSSRTYKVNSLSFDGVNVTLKFWESKTWKREKLPWPWGLTFKSEISKSRIFSEVDIVRFIEESLDLVPLRISLLAALAVNDVTVGGVPSCTQLNWEAWAFW